MNTQITEITGTKADLNTLLLNKGFRYVSEFGGWDNVKKETKTGTYVTYQNTGGKIVKMVLIKNGEKPRWLPQPEGAIFWKARTAGSPDTYKIEAF